MALAWKAGWVHALTSSNLVSSATLTRGNAALGSTVRCARLNLGQKLVSSGIRGRARVDGGGHLQTHVGDARACIWTNPALCAIHIPRSQTCRSADERPWADEKRTLSRTVQRSRRRRVTCRLDRLQNREDDIHPCPQLTSPPNLPDLAASAVVRGVNSVNNSPNRGQEEQRIKNAGRDSGNASVRRKNPPASK